MRKQLAMPAGRSSGAASSGEAAWGFADMSDNGGKLAIMWDTVAASVPFTVSQ